MAGEGGVVSPEPHQPLLSDSELRAHHAALSPLWARMLDYAEAQEEFAERSSFGDAEQQQYRFGYPVQPWPTLIEKERLAELAQLNVDLCRLLKSLPARLFGQAPEDLLSFFGLERIPPAMVRFAFDQPQYLGSLVARSDFIATADGFRCLELNSSASIGGWFNHYLAQELRRPVLDRFLDQAGVEIRATDVMLRLLSHCVGAVLRHFRSSTVNIALQVDRPGPDWAPIGQEVEAYLQRVLAPLSGISGSSRVVGAADLEARGGQLFAGETRIHLVLELDPRGSAPPTYRCWMNRTVLLIDGPLAPVIGDKRNLALLSELAESDLFDSAEKRVIAASVPWTRRLSAVSVAGQPADCPSRDRLIDQRESLVLKRAGGSGGSEVHIGAATDPARWEQQVDHALAQGDWVVQEFLDSLPFVYQSGERGSAAHEVIWGLFVFGDRYGGDILRIAPRGVPGVVNAARGASVGVLWEVQR